MVRFLVVALAVLGAVILFGRIFPSLSTVAFTVVGLGVTWIMLLGVGMTVMAYKATK